MKAAQLFVQCLENEGVEYIFGVPGEENLDLMDALIDSKIQFITTRHEQGAAFMADVYGRLTGKAGVCLSTLGPGATNLVTGVADANMDRAPVVAIAGQASTDRLHKESHQVVDLVSMFRPITKYAAQVLDADTIPEIVRKAFKLAQTEKPGASFIDFPENIAELTSSKTPLPVRQTSLVQAQQSEIEAAAECLKKAKSPLILVGNGAIRAKAAQAVFNFSQELSIPVVNSFMAKGVVPFFKNPNARGTVGLQKGDYENAGFADADLVLAIGFDMVEYHPYLWNPEHKLKILHLDTEPAEIDASYMPAVEMVGDISKNLELLLEAAKGACCWLVQPHKLRQETMREMVEKSTSQAFPLLPQKIIWDLRTALPMDAIAISDVGAHKLWMARMFRCEEPNTCIISNGFAAMGIALPGAFAAKLAYPARAVVAVTGDAGFLMNSQEIETALRYDAPFIVLVWNDAQYGMIEWKQQNKYQRAAANSFNNPDFVGYAESFGAKGYKIEAADELLPALEDALQHKGLSIIDCPVDYSETSHLSQLLGNFIAEND